MGQKVVPPASRDHDVPELGTPASGLLKELLVEDAIRKYAAPTAEARRSGSMTRERRSSSTRPRGHDHRQEGQEVDKDEAKISRICHRHIEVKTMEINWPEIDPGWSRHRRAAQKRQLPPHDEAADTTMENGAKGIRIQLAGFWAGRR
jgi:hypothetical protein